jgi:hypothetical protein
MKTKKKEGTRCGRWSRALIAEAAAEQVWEKAKRATSRM